MKAETTQRAIAAYGTAECLRAYQFHMQGEGAATVAAIGPATIHTTRQADAAINAGRAMVIEWGRTFPGWFPHVHRHFTGHLFTAHNAARDITIAEDDFAALRERLICWKEDARHA